MRKKVLILTNHIGGLLNFRGELLQQLIENNYKIFVSSPYNEKQNEEIEQLTNQGCKFIWNSFERRKINPIHEYHLINSYKKIIKEVKPDVILGYTIKPNIYGALAAKKHNIPFIANVTGMGTALNRPGIAQKITINLYKIAFSKVYTVFFQNKGNADFFERNEIAIGKHKLLPGSGVNLDYHTLQQYPTNKKQVNFVFISRIMEEKGINQYLEAADYISNKYDNIKFHICGSYQEEYKKIIEYYEKKGTIVFHGLVSDVREILKNMHATVHPSFHEGMSNGLLETAANGRPILASNIPGCQETFDEGISGYGFEPKNTESLIEAIEKFLKLSPKEKEEMGIKGRQKVVEEFDRQIVIDKYLKEIELAVEGK